MFDSSVAHREAPSMYCIAYYVYSYPTFITYLLFQRSGNVDICGAISLASFSVVLWHFFIIIYCKLFQTQIIINWYVDVCHFKLAMLWDVKKNRNESVNVKKVSAKNHFLKMFR